jgi:hypothetical protein
VRDPFEGLESGSSDDVNKGKDCRSDDISLRYGEEEYGLDGCT